MRITLKFEDALHKEKQTTNHKPKTSTINKKRLQGECK